jgi:hypothetical protein
MVSAEQQKLARRYIKHAVDNEHRIVSSNNSPSQIDS